MTRSTKADRKLVEANRKAWPRPPSRLVAPAPRRAPAEGRRSRRPKPPACSIDDFMKVDLRIARIVECQPRGGAPTSWYADPPATSTSARRSRARSSPASRRPTTRPPRRPPHRHGGQTWRTRKMKFGMSEGMVLAASDPEGKTGGPTFCPRLRRAEPGMRVSKSVLIRPPAPDPVPLTRRRFLASTAARERCRGPPGGGSVAGRQRAAGGSSSVAAGALAASPPAPPPPELEVVARPGCLVPSLQPLAGRRGDGKLLTHDRRRCQDLRLHPRPGRSHRHRPRPALRPYRRRSLAYDLADLASGIRHAWRLVATTWRLPRDLQHFPPPSPAATKPSPSSANSTTSWW